MWYEPASNRRSRSGKVLEQNALEDTLSPIVPFPSTRLHSIAKDKANRLELL
jgi:hypothetical protein